MKFDIFDKATTLYLGSVWAETIEEAYKMSEKDWAVPIVIRNSDSDS